MLSRPGVSGEIKQMYLDKHIWYTFAFMIIRSVSLVGAHFNLYNLKRTDTTYVKSPLGTGLMSVSEDGTIELSLVDWISNIAFLSSGFILAYIRTREPYF